MPAGRGRLPAWQDVRATGARVRLEHVFLVIALAWGVAQVFIVPPLQVPDEGDHWFRAWAMTDGQLTADRQGMVTLPGAFARTAELYTRLVKDNSGLPVSLEGQAGFSGYEDLFNSPGPQGTVKVVSRVASYGPVGYLPQAAGVALGRIVGAPPLTSFYLARLANLLASIALLFFAIRLAPFGKQLILLLALLPMTMYELASVSCDALTISGAMFFTALVLWGSTRSRLRWIDVALVLSSAGLLLNVKPGYWALVLLVLLIRPAPLGGRGRYAAFVAASALVVAGGFVVTFLATATEARTQVGGGPPAQLQFILHQPLGFIAILWDNILHNLLAWTLETVGILGWLAIGLPPSLYVVALIGSAGLFFGMREDVSLRGLERGLLAAVGVAMFLTMAVALYVFLESPGSGFVFFQGRYLAPVWLVLLLSVYGVRFAPMRLGIPFVAAVEVLLMLQSLQTLIVTYHP